jgi:hypothetical protein
MEKQPTFDEHPFGVRIACKLFPAVALAPPASLRRRLLEATPSE